MVYYASVQDAKDFSKLTYEEFGYADDNAFTELVNKALELGESVVDDLCNVPRGFFKAGGTSVTEYVDWDTPYTFSTYKPIVTLTSVSYDTTGYGQAPSWTALVQDTDYIYYADGRFYIFTKTPGKAEKSIKLVYTAGYSSVPPMIRTASIEVASQILHSMLQRRTSPTVEMGNVAIPSPASLKISDTVANIVALFRRRC